MDTWSLGLLHPSHQVWWLLHLLTSTLARLGLSCLRCSPYLHQPARPHSINFQRPRGAEAGAQRNDCWRLDTNALSLRLGDDKAPSTESSGQQSFQRSALTSASEPSMGGQGLTSCTRRDAARFRAGWVGELGTKPSRRALTAHCISYPVNKEDRPPVTAGRRSSDPAVTRSYPL